METLETEKAGRRRWLELADKALDGASFEDRLVSHTEDGVRIEPDRKSVV